MTDQNQNLRELLEKLRHELESTEPMDERGREILRRLDADIHTLLKRSGERPGSDDPMLERLQDSIDHFQDTHPTLTMMLSQMMTILSNAGI